MKVGFASPSGRQVQDLSRLLSREQPLTSHSKLNKIVFTINCVISQNFRIKKDLFLARVVSFVESFRCNEMILTNVGDFRAALNACVPVELNVNLKRKRLFSVTIKKRQLVIY